MKKSIALTNPSSKAVTYMVTLEGSSDFSIDGDSISLDPKFFGILCPGVARDRDVPKLGTREVVFTGALVRN